MYQIQGNQFLKVIFLQRFVVFIDSCESIQGNRGGPEVQSTVQRIRLNNLPVMGSSLELTVPL